MAKVTTTFVSDEKDVIDAIAKMNADMAKLRDQNKKLAEETKRAKEEAKSGFSETIRGAASAVMAYASIGNAVSILRKELEAVVALQDKAAGVQRNAAGSEREFLMNLGIVSPTQRDQALKQLAGISQRTGVPMTSLYGAGGSALSASGGDISTSMAALEKAAQIAPHSAQAMSDIAGAIIDLNKAMGTTEGTKGLDLLVQLQAGSRVKDMGQLATNMPQGIIGATIAGFSPEAAGALAETLSNAMVDKNGARTATAEAMLAARLREYIPEEDVYEGKGRNRKLKRKGYGPMSGEARLALVKGDDALRQGFLDTLEQSEAKPFIEALLTPGSREARMYEDSLARYKGQKPGESDKFIAGIGDTGLQRASDMERRFTASQEEMLLGALESGDYSRTRQGVLGLVEASGGGFLARQDIWSRMMVGGMTGQKPATMAKNELQNYLYGDEYLDIDESNVSRTNRMTPAQRAERDRLAEPIKRMVSVLEKIEANQHKGSPNANIEGQ